VLLLLLLTHLAAAQFFVRLDEKDKAKGGDVATTEGASDDGRPDIDTRWKNFVRWFRENGGIISSKLIIKERNGRQGVYFKERMRRGETIVSFPRTLRMDEKSAFKSKHGDMWRTLKEKEVYPDLRMVHCHRLLCSATHRCCILVMNSATNPLFGSHTWTFCRAE